MSKHVNKSHTYKMKKEYSEVELATKRASDIFISVIGLIVTAPLLLIGVAGIIITMPGPILFRQERVGKSNERFFILKLRTMIVDKEAEMELDGLSDERRITIWGNVLRRTKIDELPQFLNVLRGEMSLVGPRPTIASQVNAYTSEQRRRQDMRPGMTGLAQINGNTSIPWHDRIKYDLYYVNNFTLMLDIKILLKTVLVVAFGESYFARRIT